MPAVLPPGLSLARRGQPLARALTTAVLAIPLVLATVAFIPAFVICPFLGTEPPGHGGPAACPPAGVDGRARPAAPSVPVPGGSGEDRQ